jgi:radical SAM protein with 4Fe4S-binding SPASM domain
MTYRCNERCVHCFNPGAAHSDQQKPQRNTAELTTSEALRMIDDAYTAGAFKVCLSGGEVLVRKDFFEIAQHIRQKRMQLTIYTNGLLLNDKKLARLASLWPTLVGVSIYSANPAIHDAITKVPRSHQRSLAALKRLRALGIRTSLKAAVMDQAVQGWQSLEQMAHDIGANFQMDIQMTAGNDGAREPMQLNIQSHAELVALAVTKGSSIFVGDSSNNFGRVARSLDQPVCGAGRSTLSVNPAGDIYACVAMPMAIGNVRNEPLSALWHGSRYGLRADQPESPLSRWQAVHLHDYPECGKHERCQWCSKCPGMGLVETGDLLAPSEVQCRFAAARMTAAKFLEAGETREAIFEKLGVPHDFGTRLEPRPIKHPTHTVTFDPRAIGGRKLDARKTSP